MGNFKLFPRNVRETNHFLPKLHPLFKTAKKSAKLTCVCKLLPLPEVPEGQVNSAQTSGGEKFQRREEELRETSAHCRIIIFLIFLVQTKR